MHASESTLSVRLKSPPISAESLLETVLEVLEEKKAEEVVTIPLDGKSTLADYLIIAHGRSARQVAGLADSTIEALKAAGFGRARVEGLPQADWVLIDAGDVIVHLFRPEVRRFYNLEKMWGTDLSPEIVTH